MALGEELKDSPAQVKDTQLDALLTKWVTHAETNKTQYERVITDLRGRAQAAVDRMEKKLGDMKAAAKKGKGADFAVLLDFKNARKEVADHAAGAHGAGGELMENMLEYRGGWPVEARKIYSEAAKVPEKSIADVEKWLKTWTPKVETFYKKTQKALQGA